MFGHDDHDDEQKDETVTVEPTVSTDDATPTVTTAPQTDTPDNTVADITEVPAAEEPTVPASAPEEPAVSDAPTSEPTTATTSNADPELLELKKQALEELSPLVEHLDQTPEEKFKTTMMLIQATDSSNLISAAHAAAKEITDEKVRAQALLDIVNEINYFTQK